MNPLTLEAQSQEKQDKLSQMFEGPGLDIRSNSATLTCNSVKKDERSSTSSENIAADTQAYIDMHNENTSKYNKGSPGAWRPSEKSAYGASYWV